MVNRYLLSAEVGHSDGWLVILQETATTCRERCGGQGYLSCNRFGAILGFSHAGMTAEGDNRCAPHGKGLASIHHKANKQKKG